MPQLSQHELLARLKKDKPIPAILLLGEETYLRDACRAQLIDHYVADAARAWAVARFSADRNEVQPAIDRAQTLPMLSPQQVVFLEDAQAIEQLADKKRELAVETLEAYLGNPASFTVLVIEATHLDQRMKLAKLLTEKALVVSVGLGEDADQRQAAAASLAKTIAREQNVSFEAGAAEELAECVAGDLQRLKTEIDKLVTYAGDRKSIRREDVALMVISERAATVWEMADLLATRQPKPALDFLDRLLRDGEEPLSMLGAMAWMYRKLIEASELRSGGWHAARTLQMSPERADAAIHNARRISRPRLLAGLGALQRADDRLKHGGDSTRAVMEFLIAELAGPANATTPGAGR